MASRGPSSSPELRAEQTAKTLELSDAVATEEEVRAHARIGGYILKQELGAGAIGVVYAGFDTKLDRKVAIKLLKRQTDPKARRRLLREAQAMARLSHPGVVQVYDIDEIDGTAFIVMEFIRGVTLATWLAQRPRTLAEIIGVFEQAGAGLVAAHARGLVHRDFKPTNVMVDETGRTLVMDFGLAKEWQRDTSTTAELRAGALLDRMTTKGKVIGTPAYMSPEQLDGLEATARADQFSFCVALWEALHGQRPFRGSTVLELLVAIKQGDYQVPQSGREVPSWIREVLLRGMRLDPTQRWPSMVELLAVLEAKPEPDPLPAWVWFVLGSVAAGLFLALAWALA